MSNAPKIYTMPSQSPRISDAPPVVNSMVDPKYTATDVLPQVRPFNPISTRAEGLANAGSDLATMRKDRAQLVAQRDDLKQKLAQRKAFHASSTFVAQPGKLSDDEQSDLESTKLRAGAEAMMQWDPVAANNMLLRADQINANVEAKKQALLNKKDSNITDLRATHNTYLNYLSSLTQQGAQEDDPRVIQARGVIEATSAELRKLGIPIGTQEQIDAMSGPDIITEKSKPKPEVNDATNVLAQARTEAKGVLALVQDADQNGVIDDVSGVKSDLEDIASKYKINRGSKEWTALMALLTAKEEEVAKNKEASYKESAEKRAIHAESLTGASVDERTAKTIMESIVKEPNSVPKIANGLLWIMRKRSGAKIDAPEMLQYMGGMLTPQKRKELVNDLSPTSLSAVLGYALGGNMSDAQIMVLNDKYAPFIDRQMLLNDIGGFAAGGAIQLDKKKPAPDTRAPKVGEVRQGYEFLGGDQYDQKNWRKK